MQEKKAILNFAVFILQNKREVIFLINRLGIASLSYDSPISVVNEIVIDNAQELEEGLKSIANNGYSNYVCAGVCVYIVVSVIILATSTSIITTANRNRKAKAELLREGYTKRYINKETLGEIAFINRKEMQKQFLIAQQDYLQKEENMIQANRKADRLNIAYIMGVSIITIIIASKLTKK